MTTFEPKVVHPMNGGVQKIYTFPNGYGASVVLHNFSYGRQSGLWELAVLEMLNKDDPLDFSLTYDTPITDDVIGYLTEDKVAALLERINDLPEVWNESHKR